MPFKKNLSIRLGQPLCIICTKSIKLMHNGDVVSVRSHISFPGILCIDDVDICYITYALQLVGPTQFLFASIRLNVTLREA